MEKIIVLDKIYPVPDSFRMELAGISIDYTPIRKGRMCEFCMEYITMPSFGRNVSPMLKEGTGEAGSSPDHIIKTTEEDLAAEYESLMDEQEHERPSPDELEKNFLYRKVAELLPAHHALFFHASAVVLDGRGYLFAGPSGAGKSTHRSLWENEFKDRMRIINDDKPILRMTDKGIYVFGSPWRGKAKRGGNRSAPLCGIVFMHQAKENRIKRMSSYDAWYAIPSQVHMSREQRYAKTTIELMSRVVDTVPVYAFENNATQEAVRLAYETLA